MITMQRQEIPSEKSPFTLAGPSPRQRWLEFLKLLPAERDYLCVCFVVFVFAVLSVRERSLLLNYVPIQIYTNIFICFFYIYFT